MTKDNHFQYMRTKVVKI